MCDLAKKSAPGLLGAWLMARSVVEGDSAWVPVLTRDIPDEKVARALIVDLSRLVYAHAMR
jgi:hypothetical protein